MQNGSHKMVVSVSGLVLNMKHLLTKGTYLPNFSENPSTHGRVIVIPQIFKMAAVCHIGIVIFAC